MNTPEANFQRIVLLNHLISRSSTRSPQEHPAPIHSATELLDLLENRIKKNWAIEYFGAGRDDDEVSESDRVAQNQRHNFLRLRRLRLDKEDGETYAVLLFEYVDQSVRSFAVVNTQTFDGREISGEAQERGSAAAHLVIKLPTDGAYDDCKYRCAIESVQSVTRSDIERFFRRQLRRATNGWEFEVVAPASGRRKANSKKYQYHPRLELIADAGRRLHHAAADGRVLAHMQFTKRGEKQSIGQATEITHRDLLADVEIRIAASQGPTAPDERTTWWSKIREHFRYEGFSERLYYRHIKGATISGEVHQSLAGATDLLMCPREIVFTKRDPKRWRDTINREMVDNMKSLLDRDELWERAK